MARGRRELVARRARAALVAIGTRFPGLVRGETWASALSRELGRRLGRGAGIAPWQRVLESGNPVALRAASQAAAGVARSAPLVDAMARRAGDRPQDAALRLDLCAVLRHAGQDERAALSLAAIGGVSSRDVRPLVREALGLGEHADVVAVVRGASPRDDAAAALLDGAVLVAERLADTPDPDEAAATLARLAAERSQDRAVLAAVVTWAAHLGLAAMRALAPALATSAVDAGSVGHLATRMREAGDLRASTELAEAALARSPGNLAMRRLVTLGRTGMATLHDGWRPPDRGAAASDVAPARVDYLLHSSLPDTSLGYAVRTHGLLAALRELGWDVRGVTQPGYPEDRDAPAREVVDGVPYLRLQDGGALAHWPVEEMVQDYLRRLEPLIATERPGIVHAASNFRNGLAAVAAARRAGVPAVYEVRGLWQHTRTVREPQYAETEMFELLERLEVEAARLADRVVVITEALRAYLVERGVPSDRVVVVPNGVDTRRFAPRERDDALAAELGLVGKTVIGYVGGIVEYEGLGLLVEAMHQIATGRDDVALLVVGDGRSLPELQARAAALGLDGVVTFTGRVPHDAVERYYSLVDIAPFPRLPADVSELVSPLKPFEAMAMGKAVVVSDVAALAEIVDDGRTGVLVAKGSASALAGGLRRLLDDPELRERVAAGGLDWVRRERDWRRLALAVSQVWTELWTDHHGHPPRLSPQTSDTPRSQERP